MTTSIEFELKAMRQAYENMQRELEGVRNQPTKPWEVRSEGWVDDEANAKEALQNMRDRVVDLEHQLRDPEQDAEIFAELSAICAMNGGYDDPHLYMHTETEEKEFQEGIRHQIDYGYFDSDGHWEDGLMESRPWTCQWCGNTSFEDDECIMVEGFSVHDCIAEQVIQWAEFIGWCTNTPLIPSRWDTEFTFKEEVDA